MYARKTNVQEMCQALAKINEKYKDNVIFSENLVESKKIRFRLKVLHSHERGGRFHLTTDKGHCSPFACWHVHGDFFDALFIINPNAVIWSEGKKITKDYGNWEDKQIGIQISYSESCLCNSFDRYGVETEDELIEKISTTDISTLKDIWDEKYGAFRSKIIKYAKQLRQAVKAMQVNELYDLWKYDYFRPIIAKYGTLELAPIVLGEEACPELEILKRRLAR